jgi:glutamate/tyrosine decarboxylase-like PLP-dependent enzyme
VDSVRELLELTAAIAADYLESLETRPIFPEVTPEQLRDALGGALPEGPLDPGEVVASLASLGGDGAVALGSGRYFGFVIGGALPAALAADWLTSAWDQNAGLYAGGPAASVVEQVTREWIVDLLGLPGDASIGFVTGTQMAHVTALAAAGRKAIRISVSNWQTGDDEIDLAVEEFRAAVRTPAGLE